MTDVPTSPARALTLRGAIFDCDGILVDSEQPWLELMTGYLDRAGVVGGSPESFRGLSAAEAVSALRALDSVGGLLPTVAEVDADYSRVLEGVASPMPGARDLVRAMAGAIPIAVASNGRREDVHGLLERTGMIEFFDAIVTIDDVEEGKPAPDIYLRAAARLGIAASAAAAFEDSPVGSRAADAAGCTVFGINSDATVPLVSSVRLSDLRALRFDASARELHVTPQA